MRTIIDPNLTYYTYPCQTSDDLLIYVQPLSHGLTNIEMVSTEEGGPVQQGTASDAFSLFSIFDTYMKWML